MKKKLFLVVLVLLLTALSVPSLALEAPIGVVYNGSPMDIKPSPTIHNGRTLIPLRSIMENFGAQVTWNANDRSILITQRGTSIWLQIDNATALVNGVPTQLDAAPKLIESRTFIPIRFVSETLNLIVRWDVTSRTVYLMDTTPGSEDPVVMGSSANSLLSQLGKPARIDKSYYGFDWYIYNDDYSTYRQVGVKSGRVIAQFGFDIPTLSNGLFTSEMTRKEVEKKIGESDASILKGNTIYSLNNAHQSTYKLEDVYYTCYFDASPDQRLYAVTSMDAQTEEGFKGYFGTPSKDLATSFEREVFDITNAYRVLKKLSPLKASVPLDGSARTYSTAMGTQNFFAHVSPSGQTLKDRIQSVFQTYSAAGENIAKGQSGAIQVMNCWITSPGHLSNILGDFDTHGTGVYLGVGSQTYYTQLFIKNGTLK